MSNISSDDRLIKNEQLLRDKNASASRGLRKYFRNDVDVRQAPVAFICECSQLDCDEHITVSIDRYEKLHERRDRFVIFRGHATPQIEKIVAQEGTFDVVEKFALSR